MTYQFFIINDFDRPDRDHVVQAVSGKMVEYLSEKLTDYGALGIRDGMTPMEDFGFTWFINKGYVHFQKTQVSKAKYQDGQPRQWQGDLHFYLKLKEVK